MIHISKLLSPTSDCQLCIASTKALFLSLWYTHVLHYHLICVVLPEKQEASHKACLL